MDPKKQNHKLRKRKDKTPKAQTSLPSTYVATEDVNMTSSYEPWAPEITTAGKLFLSVRLFAALWCHITDCDEVFNYWEPLHFLVHGQGLQTWEYSPTYALRSYAYIWLHLPVVKFINTVFINSPKVVQFYMLRCILSMVCALCELYLYRGVCKALGNNIGRFSLVFMLFGVGPFQACVAFLPSSFTMYTTMLAYGAWFHKHYAMSILAVAAGTIIGWPFVAILGLPLFYDLVFRKGHIWLFIKWTIISGLLCLVPSVLLDTALYGRFTVASLNIMMYNVFTDHGPNLYGVEPWTFYFLNGFLNLNMAFLLALISILIVAIIAYNKKTTPRNIPQWLPLMGLYLWMLVFFTRPHKEERFLYPIYPLICLAAACSVDYIQKLIHHLRKERGHYVESSGVLFFVLCLSYTAINASRSLALFQGFHAPLDVYSHLNLVASNKSIHGLPAERLVNVCVGKEWHRFPSSFFLPSNNWKLQFLKSEFQGQLPKPFATGPDATAIIPSDMNDLNKEEPSRYVSVNKCHYLVDLDLPEGTQLEPRYSTQTANWTIIFSSTFLDVSRCPQPLRSFYIPFLTTSKCTFVNYNLLQSTSLSRQRSKS